MPAGAPTPQQLFSDRHGVAVLEAFEDYKAELAKSIDRSDEGRDFWMAKSAGGDGKILRNVRPPKGYAGQRDADLSTLEELSKSLTADQVSAMAGQLESLRERVSKDWDSQFPETGTLTVNAQLAPIDLEAPAKLIVPRETPLVNTMPRENDGIGSAVQYRRITGWSNSGVGGVPDLSSFLASEYPSSQSTNNLPTFGGYSNTTGGVASGGLGLRRGQKITYASDAHQVTYTEQSLSDVVSTKAYYIGQGFQDVRQLSATALLWAHKGAEERNMLYGRGTTALGYTGPISAPGNPTVANSTGSITSATYYVVITAVGSGGESVTNATQQSVTVSTGGISVTLPTLPAGATGFNIYSSIASGTGGPYYFQQTVSGGYAGSAVILTATPVNTTPSLSAIAAVADTTANPNGYDGMLTVLLGSNSGYTGTYSVNGTLAHSVNSVGGAVAGTVACGDAPWQLAFSTLYGSNTNPGNYAMSTGGLAATAWPWTAGVAYGNKLLARPQTIYVDGSIRAAMGTFVRTAAGGSTAYRLVMPSDTASAGGMNVGAIVNGIANQTTGDMTDFDVHPYMPPGASIIWTKQLPFPDSEITNTIVAKNVQDYMYQMWPQIQFTWDASTYQLGTMVFYAPAWSGALVGLLP